VIRVVKVGGRPQSDPQLPAKLASQWDRESAGLVVVHGGGDEISTLQTALGGSTTFVGGRRVTSEADIGIVRMALSGSANKRLVSALVDSGIEAVGLSGEDAGLIAAAPVDVEKMGYVGKPCRINVAFLQHLLAGGYLPVISPVSRDGSGTLHSALNVNGDDAASAIAVAMHATELLLVADVAGVMRDGRVIDHLTSEDAKAMIADGTASAGMRAKLEAALTAVAGGVARVRISDINAIADDSRGTFLSAIGELS
jgi:acetylglutamate kinase